MDPIAARAALAHLSAQLNDLRATSVAIAGILGFLVLLDPNDDPKGHGLLAACIGSFGLVADVILTALLPS